MHPIIECVPNFSEGRDPAIIKQITDTIERVEGVKLLDVDPGKATNRTVVTFVGAPEPVCEAAFRAVKKAAELIDMSKHQGEHPRMGATDVCPLIPVSDISMHEVAYFAHKLGERIGQELGIPIYMYEDAATRDEWKNLATVRSGEYEALDEKLRDPKWAPDYGPAQFNAKAGATAVGARDFLIAYNVNLNTTSPRRANSVAFDIREKGRIKREGGTLTGEIIRDENGDPIREKGMCDAVKGIGWYIEEYGIAQVSMNLTDISKTSIHEAFEACVKSALNRGMRVTGSELVGLVPKKVMIEAGKYFLKKQERSVGIPEEEIIHIAVKSMGLDELSPFDIKKKIIEYQLEDEGTKLVHQSLKEFSDNIAIESPAPGGGSVAAYAGSMGAALATMVANLSAHKRGWDDKWESFSKIAEKGMALQKRLLELVDEDTEAFNGIIEAIRLPKSNEEEKKARKEAIDEATRQAIRIPLEVMRTSAKIYPIADAMATDGNPNSVSDAGVGALCAHAAIKGAYMNVLINCDGFKDIEFVKAAKYEAEELLALSEKESSRIEKGVISKIIG